MDSRISQEQSCAEPKNKPWHGGQVWQMPDLFGTDGNAPFWLRSFGVSSGSLSCAQCLSCLFPFSFHSHPSPVSLSLIVVLRPGACGRVVGVCWCVDASRVDRVGCSSETLSSGMVVAPLYVTELVFASQKQLTVTGVRRVGVTIAS